MVRPPWRSVSIARMRALCVSRRGRRRSGRDAQHVGGMAFVGAVMALGTLFVLDASAARRLHRRHRRPRLCPDARFHDAGVVPAVQRVQCALGRRKRVRGAVFEPLALGLRRVVGAVTSAVVYVPLLQQAFSTVALSARDWLTCAIVGSSVLCLSEAKKLLVRTLARAALKSNPTQRTPRARAACSRSPQLPGCVCRSSGA